VSFNFNCCFSSGFSLSICCLISVEFSVFNALSFLFGIFLGGEMLLCSPDINLDNSFRRGGENDFSLGLEFDDFFLLISDSCPDSVIDWLVFDS